ncbi:MAG: hypothetical protein ACRDL5_11700, partial [Solirubrobacteraceae bacterium]
VEPNGTGVAFDAAVPASDGACSDNCPGLYSLIAGRLLRLSAASADCGNVTTYCGGEQIDPAVTSDGRVVYYSLFATSTPVCGIYYCGSDGAYIEQYYSRALDGSDSPTVWPLPPEINGQDPYGAEPNFGDALASDPADPTKIAYTGDWVKGLDILDGGACGPQGENDCYPLDVEDSSGAYNQTSVDDSYYYGLAFSQDGSEIADLETGDHKGIWVYPSSQTYTAASPRFTWALADPDDVPGSGEFDMVVSGLTFVGDARLVFSAENNLWSIPASCWATAASPSAPAPDCGTFPAGATQLTRDGSASAPDLDPSWTSSTAPIAAFGAGSAPTPGPTSGPTPTSETPDRLTRLALAARIIHRGQPLILKITLSAKARITVAILRSVPASGHGKDRRRAHYRLLGRLAVSGRAGRNKLRLVRVHGRVLTAGTYEAQVSAGGPTHTLRFKVGR